MENSAEASTKPDCLATRSGRLYPRSDVKKLPGSPFRFLELPPELRLMIYEEYVKTPRGISVCARDCSKSTTEYHKATWSQPRYSSGGPEEEVTYNAKTNSFNSTPWVILGVCRSIRAEASPIFYGSTTFAFLNAGTVRPFLMDLSESARRMIRNVEMYFDVTEETTLLTRAALYVANRLRLKTLNVTVWDYSATFDRDAYFNPESLDFEWVHALCYIEELEDLSFSLLLPPDDYAYDSDVSEGPAYEEFHNLGMDISCFMDCHMLSRKALARLYEKSGEDP